MENGKKGLEVTSQTETLRNLGCYAISFAIKAAMEIDLFRTINKGFSTNEEIAKHLELEPTALRELMRVLVSIGFFTEEQPDCYSATQCGLAFQPNTPNSIAPQAEYILSEALIQPMMNLSYSIRTGKSSFEHIIGSRWYEYGNDNPELARIMDQAMKMFSNRSLPQLLANYDFSKNDLIVDIAGGLGHILAGILQANPKAKGILFDLPATIDRATIYLNGLGLDARCELITGDMFGKIPTGGDLYIISKVLNDWGDEHVLTILQNVRTAMSSNSKLIIIEDFRMGDDSTPDSAIRGLFLLACTGGKLRSVAEFRNLIYDADMEITRIIPVPSQFSIIECIPTRPSTSVV